MRKIAIICAGSLSIAGCNFGSSVATANNTLSTLAGGNVKLGCDILATAEGYYSQIVGQPTGALALAEQSASIVCANPPKDIVGAFATLLQVWTVVQAATVAPAIPSPKPTTTP